MARRFLALLAAGGLLLVGAAPAGAANINSQNAYVVANLQSNVPGRAANTDPDLVNGWGITAGPTTPWWVNDNGTHKSTLYNGNTGTKITQVIVNVAGANSQPADPTGIVFNGVAGDFRLDPANATSAPGSSSTARTARSPAGPAVGLDGQVHLVQWRHLQGPRDRDRPAATSTCTPRTSTTTMST